MYCLNQKFLTQSLNDILKLYLKLGASHLFWGEGLQFIYHIHKDMWHI